MTEAENNKQTVIAYYNMAFNERKPAEAAQKYGGDHYIQHNPQAPDGFEAFVGFVEGFVEQFPQMSLEIKRALAKGLLTFPRGWTRADTTVSGGSTGGKGRKSRSLRSERTAGATGGVA